MVVTGLPACGLKHPGDLAIICSNLAPGGTNISFPPRIQLGFGIDLLILVFGGRARRPFSMEIGVVVEGAQMLKEKYM